MFNYNWKCISLANQNNGVLSYDSRYPYVPIWVASCWWRIPEWSESAFGSGTISRPTRLESRLDKLSCQVHFSLLFNTYADWSPFHCSIFPHYSMPSLWFPWSGASLGRRRWSGGPWRPGRHWSTQCHARRKRRGRRKGLIWSNWKLLTPYFFCKINNFPPLLSRLYLQ